MMNVSRYLNLGLLNPLVSWTKPFGSVRNYSSSKNSTNAILSDLLDFPSSKSTSTQLPQYGGVSRINANIIPPPRTGVYAGRSVAINRPEDLPRMVGKLNQINRINKVREVKNLQRYHERPGKAKWRLKMARKRREFRSGMRMLFHLALQAEKRGL